MNILFQLPPIVDNIYLHSTDPLCLQMLVLHRNAANNPDNTYSVFGIRRQLEYCAGMVKFTINSQEDPQEFLMYLLQVLENKNIPINEIFQISYMWKHTCTLCNNVTQEEIPNERFIYIYINTKL